MQDAFQVLNYHPKMFRDRENDLELTARGGSGANATKLNLLPEILRNKYEASLKIIFGLAKKSDLSKNVIITYFSEIYQKSDVLHTFVYVKKNNCHHLLQRRILKYRHLTAFLSGTQVVKNQKK